MSNPAHHYLGNPKLKKANVRLDYTDEEVKELAECSRNIDLFCSKYCLITNIDEGLVPFEPYPYQFNIMDKVIRNRFVICKMPRQSGKTTCMVAIMLWFALFNPEFKIAILANKASMSREILSRIKLAYENLPFWLQQGVLEWNKGNIELENGAQIIASSTSSTAIRGLTMNLVYLDEFAFVPHYIQEDFFSSVYPTITSGKTSRVLITSTPNGMNMFYKMWTDAEQDRNDYETVDVHWSDVPGRDEKWREETIRNTSEQQFAVEFGCEFLGSINTLIDPSKLRTIVFNNPLQEHENVRIFKEPEPNHTYLISVDTSRGVGSDYSAFIVFDVSKVPYEVVCTYRSNVIAPMLYPSVIVEAGKKYNDAFILVETNDIGGQVADTIHHEFEYENLMKSEWKGRAGQVVGGGFGGGQSQLGVRTTKSLKKVGTSTLKTIIESDKLVLNDFEILSELTTYVANKRGTSFEADQGCNDDYIACLVMFAWISNQDYFKELTDLDIRKHLLDANAKAIEDDVSPFGFVDSGNSNTWEDDDEFKGGELIVDHPYIIDDVKNY